MERALVTASGTSVPIDTVRVLSNRARGVFGASLVRQLLARSWRVTHLVAAAAERLDRVTLDLDQKDDPLVRARRAVDAWEAVRDRCSVVPFTSFDEYAQLLENCCRDQQPAVAFLSAAVSDFAPARHVGKVSSDLPALSLSLTRLPKLLPLVKAWSPTTLVVGFKLTAGLDADACIATTRKAGQQSGADVTIGNDWQTVQAGDHTVHLVRDQGPAVTLRQRDFPGDSLADQVVRQILDWRQERI